MAWYARPVAASVPAPDHWMVPFMHKLGRPDIE